MPNVAINPLPENVVDTFAKARAQHHIRIKSEVRYDNLSSFICGCGTEFLAGNRTPGDIDRHLAEVFATVLAATNGPTEERLREITKAAIDRRPYDDRTRREIRGLENVIARDIAFELSKES